MRVHRYRSLHRVSMLALTAAAAVAVGAVGCDALPDIEVGICGNAIVERDRGEECDVHVDPAFKDTAAIAKACAETFGGDGAVTKCEVACAASTDANACQYVWGKDTTSENETVYRVCPPGFGAGADGVCRRPSGYFGLQPALSIPAGGFDGLAADLDGDEQDDLAVTVAGAYGGAHLTYLGAGEIVAGPSFLPTSPAVGELSSDFEIAAADIVLPLGGSLVTLRGEPGPSLNPKAYTPFRFSGDIPFPGFEGAADRILAPRKRPDGFDQPYVVVDLPGPKLGFLEASLVSFSQEQAHVIVPGLSLAQLESPSTVVSVDIDGATGGEFVLATETEIHVVSPELLPNPTMIDYPRIAVKPQATIAQLLPVSGWPVPAAVAVVELPDQHAELALLERDPMTDTYGLRYFTIDDPTPEPNQSTIAAADVRAVGDIDGDGDLDLVTKDTVAFLDYADPAMVGAPYTASSFVVVGQATSGDWVQVRVADLNGNGRKSVVATNASTTVDVLLPGTSFAMTPVPLEAGATVELLEIGDYDGDGIEDVLVSTELTGTGAAEDCYFDTDAGQVPANDDMLLAYGRPAGAPAAFTLVGSVPGLTQLASGRLANDSSIDAVADVGIRTLCDPATLEPDGRAGILIGSPERTVYSPYLPYNGPCEALSYIYRAAVGDVGAAPNETEPHDDLVLLALRHGDGGFRYEVSPVLGARDAELATVDGTEVCMTPQASIPMVLSIPVDDNLPEPIELAGLHQPAILVADFLPDTTEAEAVTATTHTAMDGAVVTSVTLLSYAGGRLETHVLDTGFSQAATVAKVRAVDADGAGGLDVVVTLLATSADGSSTTRSWLLVNDPAGATHLSDPIELVGVSGVGPADQSPVNDVARFSAAPLCPDQSGLDLDDRRECDAERVLMMATTSVVQACAELDRTTGAPVTSTGCRDLVVRDAVFDPVQGVVVFDYDGDGLEDLAVMGAYDVAIHRQCAFSEVLSGRCDAFGAFGGTDPGTGIR